MRDWTTARQGSGRPNRRLVGDWGRHARHRPRASYAAPGETIRFVLTATDNAGLSRAGDSALARDRAPPGGAPATTVIGGDGPLGEPGRIEGSGASLPNFSRIETRGIRAHQARSYSRTGRLLDPADRLDVLTPD